MRLCVQTNNAEDTQELGRKIGEQLSGGEVIELISDLGGGKTTLTKGIVRGVGSADDVSSPTFTVSNLYRSDALTVHHYDFYRLGELGIMSDELQETLQDIRSVSVIEWAGEASSQLPKDMLIRIEINPVEYDENVRELKLDIGANVNVTANTIGAREC